MKAEILADSYVIWLTSKKKKKDQITQVYSIKKTTTPPPKNAIQKTNMTIENQPFEDVSPINNWLFSI